MISDLFCAASSSVEPPSHCAPGFMVPRSPLHIMPLSLTVLPHTYFYVVRGDLPKGLSCYFPAIHAEPCPVKLECNFEQVPHTVRKIPRMSEGVRLQAVLRRTIKDLQNENASENCHYYYKSIIADEIKPYSLQFGNFKLKTGSATSQQY